MTEQEAHRLGVAFDSKLDRGQQGQDLAVLRTHGRFSVDFLVRRERPDGRWGVSALEINLRMGGTTHPMLALRFLTGGKLDLVDILTINHLSFSHRTATGILFHMIGAISEFGKVGMMAIGNDRREADALYARAVEILDRKSVFVGA